ncbi:NDR1/HIN1-like protein 1 [Physcomitrium patens]|uniref:Late embryogenesis abundant protein LEA-2 subgroup domain-containing protein n=1 Tax=Physcomitrium patens TaxID=3218 RepID=A0A2K1KPH4_PHYPA|nr:NDR1/HIN1-like protein 1 [Physcomitrium patens]XP_024374459.1 NDR1/HIN1-like protein 1 [Physcomitrium patens]PNR55695.1 hypothetical protein PHYPA_006592 [Physcomitrium patens]|eukprot:XP_024374458.1 NDR1/HIN1-like protein 1 [Physcomitrella patens]
MTTKFMSNMSRTFSNSGFSRTYSSAPKPFHFTKLHQANMSPLPPPATQKPKKDNSTCWAIFCCCFTGCISMLITAAIVLGITALIIWLVLRPVHMPRYNIQDVNVVRFAYNSVPRTLDSEVRYVVNANNPNGKIGIRYETITIDTVYMTQNLNQHSIPGFYHGHRNVTLKPASFSTTGLPLDPGTGAILEGHIATGDVPLVMRVRVKFNLKIGAITTPTFTVKVNCNVHIKPPIGTTPASVLGSPTCKRV